LKLRARPFAALFDAVAACVQSDRDGLERALAGVPARRLFSQAVRHKCCGLLLYNIASLRIRTPELRELVELLRRYAGTAALDAVATRSQVLDILEILSEHSIPNALLKGSARLFAGDRITEWTHTFAIDVFVPHEAADAAASALLERGYRYQFDAATIAGYRRHHQHLAPLLPPGAGKPVELHVALMLSSYFSLRCDWHALKWHLEPMDESGSVLRLDAFGRALHMAMHGAGMYRLGDAAQMALELRSDPDLYRRLYAFMSGECIQPIPLLGVLAAGAQLAGMDVDVEPAVRRYVEWTIAREDLPELCHNRMQLVDAWFANGGAFTGPATRLAFPPTRRYDGSATSYAERFRILAGRVVAGVAGAGYRSFL